MKAAAAKRLREVTRELTFEPHRIRLDGTGRYDEYLEREFPFVVRLFHYRHKDFTPGLTWHERLEIFMPLDAPATMRMGNREVDLTPGEILIVDNLKLHMTVDRPGLNCRVVVISFFPEFVYSLGSPSFDYFFLLPFYARTADRAHVVRSDAESLGEMHATIAELLSCYFSRDAYYQAGCKALFLRLLYLLARQFRGADYQRSEMIRQQERAAKLTPVFDYIAKRYADPVTLKESAALAKMSLPQFVKLFKKVAGMTFVTYVTHVRLSHALRLLKESPLSIAEVAAQVGFADQSYFDRRFKAAFGQTPSAFRPKNRGPVQIVLKKDQGLLADGRAEAL